jgi:signal peptidase II
MATKSSGSLLPWLGLAAIVILIDQFTKTLIVGAFANGGSHTVNAFLNIVRVHNTGAAFSFLAGAAGWQRWFFVVLGVAAALFIVWMLRSHAGQKLFSWALALILGGAIGNVIDRLHIGQVVDFLLVYYGTWSWPAFNVADSAITIGAGLLILDSFRSRHADAPHAT